MKSYVSGLAVLALAVFGDAATTTVTSIKTVTQTQVSTKIVVSSVSKTVVSTKVATKTVTSTKTVCQTSCSTSQVPAPTQFSIKATNSTSTSGSGALYVVLQDLDGFDASALHLSANTSSAAAFKLASNGTLINDKGARAGEPSFIQTRDASGSAQDASGVLVGEMSAVSSTGFTFQYTNCTYGNPQLRCKFTNPAAYDATFWVCGDFLLFAEAGTTSDTLECGSTPIYQVDLTLIKPTA